MRHTPIRYILFGMIALLCQPLVLLAQSQDSLKILFVGNSYTYFHNLPQTVREMAATQNLHWVTRKSTAGGTTLKQHWDGERELRSRELITEGDWDFVVLQNHSLSSINTPEEFLEYGKRFIALVKQQGATPVLYVTWARKYNPLMQRQITEAYQKLAEEGGVFIAPVGQVWEQVRSLRPELELYHPDGSHPSPVGTYLAATVFYGIFSGRATADIPHRIVSTDQNGEEVYFSIMTEENADFLQQAVDEYLHLSQPVRHE